MKKQIFVILLVALFLAGCAAGARTTNSRVYIGGYSNLGGGNAVAVLNGTIYDAVVTACGNTVRLKPGARVDFAIYFNEVAVFTAVVLDAGGRVVGTTERSFQANGRPAAWHIISFNRLRK